jgi:GH15 family glucan-1,4-alpha-glucosidase
VEQRYPSIGDYALIGDCHSAALVSATGSIDWCCMPRMDDGSTFGRLLDWDRAGYCSVRATDGGARYLRSYLADTMVLETRLRTSTGEARLLDCFTAHPGGAVDPYRQLLRVVEGVTGTVTLAVTVAARFDYGGVKPWLRLHRPWLWSAVGGDDAIVISGDFDLRAVDVHDLRAGATVRAGERARLAIAWYPPESLEPVPPEQPDAAELDRRLDATVEWWRDWAGAAQLAGPDGPAVRRSALVLKALTNAPTGAIAAAPTTSLPESIGAARNWDYRYSWIRDSQFTVRSLGDLGFESEADGFRRFVERSAAGSAESLQIMYGLGGERRLTEVTLGLDGYRQSRPVRVGNAASEQFQADVYGELLELAWRWHQRGRSPDDDYWRFLLSLVDAAADRWEEPDRGLWEIRGEPRHFVHSKVMCWAALDRGIKLAGECLRQAPLERWRRVRDRIHESVTENGFDDRRQCFVQSYGSPDVDAALLLLPSVDFVAYDDPRMVATADVVAEDLDDGGLLRRYRGDDALDGSEGVFIACSFWLAECLAYQGRPVPARQVYDRAAATANDLGLYAEEFDTAHGVQLGNFPQGLTHLSHIAAAVALARTTADPGVGPPR